MAPKIPVEVLGEKNEETKVELEAEIITFNLSTIGSEGQAKVSSRGINRLRITRDLVCGQLLNHSVAVLLVQCARVEHRAFQEIYSAVSTALAFYRVPTIGNSYPTFLRTSPPFSREAAVFIRVLDQLNYREVVTMTVEDDEKTARTWRRRSRKKLQDSISNVVVLYARRVHAEKIFAAASSFVGEGRVWLVNEAAGRASNLPEGFLSVRLKQTVQSALKDALIVLREASKVLLTFNETATPPAHCEKTSLQQREKEWINVAGKQFYKTLINTVAFGDEDEIRFDENGDRATTAYDVLNAQTDGSTVGDRRVNHAGELRLDESLIVWPGGTRSKPSEITLPKRLRVVVVPDIPFVYHLPVTHAKECAGFRTIRLENVDVVLAVASRVRNGENSTHTFCCAGLAIDLLTAISRMDPSFSFDLFLNETYGAVLLGEDGYYATGMIDQLDSDQADVALGALSINAERAQYIEFTSPWMFHGVRILEKWKPREPPMSSFLQPLKPSLCSPFEKFYPDQNPLDARHLTNHDTRLTFVEAIWFVYGVLLNSGVSEKTPRSFSVRDVESFGIVFVCGFCMIVVASFTANLAAFLVLFDDSSEKDSNGNQRPAIPQSVHQLHYFKRNIEYTAIFRKMEAHNVDSARDAVNALLNDSRPRRPRDCRLGMPGILREPANFLIFGRSAYAIGLQKGNPWTPHFTTAILKLSENGTLEALTRKWIHEAGSTACKHDIPKSPARLGLANMRDLFILVAAGSALRLRFEKNDLLARSYVARWKRQSQRRARGETVEVCESPNVLQLAAIVSSRRGQQLKLDSPRPAAAIAPTFRRKKPDVFVPDLNFNRQPARMYCPKCRQPIRNEHAAGRRRVRDRLLRFLLSSLPLAVRLGPVVPHVVC
ncbi:hypothetical protein M3Y99_00179400 [Aphelenchoides fujianensis]|nr:hypothetical protein M3Y99_00179400 [Aphelenchoides fujianensis]